MKSDYQHWSVDDTGIRVRRGFVGLAWPGVIQSRDGYGSGDTRFTIADRNVPRTRDNASGNATPTP